MRYGFNVDEQLSHFLIIKLNYDDNCLAVHKETRSLNSAFLTTDTDNWCRYRDMLSKLLLTIFVVLVAFLVLRQRSKQQSDQSRRPKTEDRLLTKAAQKDELSQDLRIGAYLFLILTVGIGLTMYYFKWQDDRRVLTINLYRESQLQPISYEVYKYQLQDKSFVTTEGVSVTVASSERMEIEGLE